VPGASAYFLGGAVVYTGQARTVLLELPATALAGMRPATEAYARLVATHTRQRFSSDWALAETGATGPTGNRYGDPAGHSCMAVAGAVEASLTLETGSADRLANMHAFTEAALKFLLRNLSP
jgi:nicotinamide-nucleotide amidase